MKYCLLVVIALAILSVTGCNHAAHPENKQSVSTELAASYSSVEEMLADTKIVIEGNVLSHETMVHGDMPFTISKVEVKDTLKGDIEANTLTVIETGGKYKPEGKPGDDLPEQDFKMNGVPTLAPDEQVILFLDEFIGPQTEGAFIPIGAYQGKFKVTEDGKLEQITDSEYKLSFFEMKSISTIEKLRKRLDEGE